MGFFGVKKRHPYPSVQRSFGVKAIIDCILLSPAWPSASIRKYSHVFWRIEPDEMLTPFGPSLSAVSHSTSSSWPRGSRPNCSWPRAALSPEGFDWAQPKSKWIRHRIYALKDLVWILPSPLPLWEGLQAQHGFADMLFRWVRMMHYSSSANDCLSSHFLWHF